MKSTQRTSALTSCARTSFSCGDPVSTLTSASPSLEISLPLPTKVPLPSSPLTDSFSYHVLLTFTMLFSPGPSNLPRKKSPRSRFPPRLLPLPPFILLLDLSTPAPSSSHIEHTTSPPLSPFSEPHYTSPSPLSMTKSKPASPMKCSTASFMHSCHSRNMSASHKANGALVAVDAGNVLVAFLAYSNSL